MYSLPHKQKTTYVCDTRRPSDILPKSQDRAALSLDRTFGYAWPEVTAINLSGIKLTKRLQDTSECFKSAFAACLRWICLRCRISVCLATICLITFCLRCEHLRMWSIPKRSVPSYCTRAYGQTFLTEATWLPSPVISNEHHMLC